TSSTMGVGGATAGNGSTSTALGTGGSSSGYGANGGTSSSLAAGGATAGSGQSSSALGAGASSAGTDRTASNDHDRGRHRGRHNELRYARRHRPLWRKLSLRQRHYFPGRLLGGGRRRFTWLTYRIFRLRCRSQWEQKMKTLLPFALVLTLAAPALAQQGSATAGSAGTAAVGGNSASTLGAGAVSNSPSGGASALGVGAAAAGDNTKTRAAVHGNNNLNG